MCFLGEKIRNMLQFQKKKLYLMAQYMIKWSITTVCHLFLEANKLEMSALVPGIAVEILLTIYSENVDKLALVYQHLLYKIYVSSIE